MLGITSANFIHLRFAGCAFRNEVLGKGSVLDVGEDPLHLRFGVGGDQTRTTDVVPVFRRIGDGVAHGGQTTLHHQVNDQLDFMQALEIGELRLIAGFHQGFEAGFDQLRETARREQPVHQRGQSRFLL